MIKKCEWCGKEYETELYWWRFCSEKCYQASVDERKSRLIKCKVCGKNFHPIRGNQKYCSNECRNEAKRIQAHNYYIKNRKTCIEHANNYRKRHKEKYNAYSRKYYSNNKELVSQRTKKHRLENHEEILKKEQAYRDTHRTERREANRRWYRKKKIEACKAKHNDCFSCPTLDGECLFDY